MPRPLTRWAFGIGMTPAQRAVLFAASSPQGLGPSLEAVDRSAMPDIPITWVLTLRDRTLRPKAQRRFMRNLDRVDEVVEIDACHDAMITEPDRLADILLERIPA